MPKLTVIQNKIWIELDEYPLDELNANDEKIYIWIRYQILKKFLNSLYC